ncbi:cupredoxin family copper-binding protein [Methylocapsa sp. D3K7]|uniref:cupredoxin domain-containing protein n=1 Tax=Methylocapsa sp. D3K7 TaxID=3041435 RepID=UPI00244ED31C|nr:cupredoxin family copper-binding protein [Methylocapsa sp. D3K7]WGJ13948.1 cupredoxin family copper-binding protein [Methylocapsa sp. D3K7]
MLPGRVLAGFAAIILGMTSVPAHALTIQVTIDRLIFSPVEIIAKVGDTVVWRNKDIVAHTATVRGGFDVMIEPDNSASLVLTKAGIVDYYCRFHPDMTGRITIAPD